LPTGPCSTVIAGVSTPDDSQHSSARAARGARLIGGVRQRQLTQADLSVAGGRATTAFSTVSDFRRIACHSLARLASSFGWSEPCG
jgi:hypothetical protein